MSDKAVFSYDAVLILSQSDWYNEMRSNRYNYTTRFSKLVPVYFIQAFNKNQSNLVAGVHGNLTIVNPIHGYSDETIQNVFHQLIPKDIKKVLIWIYNPYYTQVLQRITIPYLAVFHATEAFLGSNFISSPDNKFVVDYVDKIRQTINFCSLVIAVSEGVAEGIRNDEHIVVPVHEVSNGCDFPFWNGFESAVKREDAVIYQGGIHRKVDFSLLLFLIERNTNIQFWFCGQQSIEKTEDQVKWKAILSKSNVKFYGTLHPEEVRDLSHKAKIGIIPFKNEDWLSDKSFPLKAFEYLASGLEVISTPVKSLEPYVQHFSFYENYEGFDKAIKNIILNTPTKENKRIEVCKAQDYDIKFSQVLDLIENEDAIVNNSIGYRKNILLLYDIYSCHVNTIREHVNAFGIYSKHNVTYYNGKRGERINKHFLDSFDAVVIHYSIRLSQPGYFSNSIFKKLIKFSGLKILLIQDEYDNLASTYKYMDAIKFNIVFTCVPKEYHSYVYPKSRFPNIKLINNFTGYTSYNLNNFHTIPIKDRENDVFYRGRKLPEFYGTLGVEKYEIGVKFKENSERYGFNLKLDLESDDSKRIYGDAWYKIISRSKTMLGTESGSNVFDFKGDLKVNIKNDLKKGADYNLIFKKYLEKQEQDVKMNQISPKLFEAIALKTVLILYEGEYSNVLIPYKHYIPLKKDFSNFVEVVGLINNDNYLQSIADNAYRDIYDNHELSYKYYIQDLFDTAINDNIFFLKKMKMLLRTKIFINSIHYKFRALQTFSGYNSSYTIPTITSDEYENNRLLLLKFSSIKFKTLNLIKKMLIKTLGIFPVGTLEYLSMVSIKLKRTLTK